MIGGRASTRNGQTGKKGSRDGEMAIWSGGKICESVGRALTEENSTVVMLGVAE